MNEGFEPACMFLAYVKVTRVFILARYFRLH